MGIGTGKDPGGRSGGVEIQVRDMVIGSDNRMEGKEDSIEELDILRKKKGR